MKETITLLTPIINGAIPAIIASIISYIMAVKKSKLELEKVREQSTLELEKVKEQNKVELQKIQEQSKTELQKSQNELEKIRLESERELQKVQLELDKQAELYSKNAETDALNAFMGQFMGQFFTDPKGMEEKMVLLERLGNLGQRMQG